MPPPKTAIPPASVNPFLKRAVAIAGDMTLGGPREALASLDHKRELYKADLLIRRISQKEHDETQADIDQAEAELLRRYPELKNPPTP